MRVENKFIVEEESGASRVDLDSMASQGHRFFAVWMERHPRGAGGIYRRGFRRRGSGEA